MSITQTKTDYATKVTETKTFAQGAVLKVYVDSYQIMSDIWGQAKWATYWDEEAGKVSNTMVDVCDYTWSGTGTAEVDATPEALAKAREWFLKQETEKALGSLTENSWKMDKGDTVKVVSGRTAKGTVGKVVVSIYRDYKSGWSANSERKFGIATSEEMVDYAAPNGKVYKNHKDMVWVWARNCQLATQKPVDMAEVARIAEARTSATMKQFEAVKKAA